MDIKGKDVLVLGGAGLVGIAVCRQILQANPSRMIVCSLHRHEVDTALAYVREKFPDSSTEISGTHGNLFVRCDLQDIPRSEILAESRYRRMIIEDTLEPLDEEVLARSCLFRELTTHRPDVVVDCVNTATALAYQDLYRSASEVLTHLDAGHGIETFRDALERHLCTLYTPQLIRHIQILHKGLLAGGVRAYVKIGTSGTGGMGLNIPYTHSEEKPSRVLLSKTAMGGAHSLLLFLMARTPEGPVVKEIKPTAAIAWKQIACGPVMRAGRPIRLYDCSPDDPIDLAQDKDLGASRKFAALSDGEDGVLRSVYIDTGENGMFSRAEFEVLTSLGQMEFVTPEEIAENVRFEIEGINTGHDVINALDNGCMGPTYRAGVLRHTALEQLGALEDEHHVASVAFEMLGPPRLSKLLYEADLLRRIRDTYRAVAEDRPERLSEELESLVRCDRGLRAEMLSIGIPVLLSDGRHLLRGPRMVIPAPWDVTEPNRELIDRWSEEGWVDLRPSNIRRWQDRFRRISAEIESLDASDTSSHYDRNRSYWNSEREINIGKTVGWLFSDEEHGRRMKA